MDAAHFLAAYYLGFPWEFLDANDRVLSYLKDASSADGGLPEIDNALAWVLSGAAAEAAIDGVLIQSGTSSTSRILKTLGFKSRERRTRMQVAYENARIFVNNNHRLINSISRIMYEGESCSDCLELFAFVAEK